MINFLALLILSSLATQSLAWHFPWKKEQPKTDSFTTILLGALAESPASKWKTGGVPFIDFFPMQPDNPKPEAKQEALRDGKVNRYRIRLSKDDGSLNTSSIDGMQIDFYINKESEASAALTAIFTGKKAKKRAEVVIKWYAHINDSQKNAQLSAQYFKNKDTFYKLRVDRCTKCTSLPTRGAEKGSHIISCQTKFSTLEEFYEKLRSINQQVH